jgi:hypothetical protein
MHLHKGSFNNPIVIGAGPVSIKNMLASFFGIAAASGVDLSRISAMVPKGTPKHSTESGKARIKAANEKRLRKMYRNKARAEQQ